jgi:DNA modification methylase
MIENRIVKTELIKWREIKPLQPDNLKHIFNYKYIEDSILTHGFSMPFFVWQNGNDIFAVDGHSRIEVLNNLENVPEELPATFINAKDRKEAIEILLEVFNQKSNPIANEVLTEWVEIEQISVNVQSLNVKIEELEEEVEKLEANEDDFDATPPETPITVLGDLYEIGEHRLLCGDSTDSDQVAKLMNGSKADMVFTDPPYGISHSGKGIKGSATENDFGEILNDDDVSIAIDNFNLVSSLFPNATLIYWGANYYPNCFPNGYGWLFWDKDREGNTFSGGEIAFVNKGVRFDVFKHRWHGMIKASEIGEKRVHPTQKPIELVKFCFENYNAGNLVADFFLGSGSTMVASHQLKRKCYGMELDCRYADVIVKRMVKLDPTLTIKRNGLVTKDFI